MQIQARKMVRENLTAYAFMECTNSQLMKCPHKVNVKFYEALSIVTEMLIQFELASCLVRNIINCTIVCSIITVISCIESLWHHYRKSWKLLTNPTR